MSKAKDAMKDVERLSGYDCGPKPTPLMTAILDTLHAEAAKSPTGYLDSQEITAALTFHLVQVVRGMPDRYRQKKIDEVCETLRELGNMPFRPDQVMHGAVGEA